MRRTRRQLRPVAVKSGVADVYIEGVIGAKDGTTAAGFREQLTAASGASELRVHINSEGGSVRQGMVIYNALRAFPGAKVAIIEGLAASMASIIMQACDERVMTKGAFVMIHNVAAEADGDASDLRKVADIIEKMQGDALDIYESRTGKPRAELEGLLKEETWYSAEEAVANGFADSVDGTEARVSFDAVARLNPKKIPEALRALAQEKPMAKMTDDEAKALEDKCKALEEENAKLKAKAEEGDDDDGEKEDPESEEDSEEDEPESSDDDEKKEAKALIRDVRKLTGAKSNAEARGALMAIAHKAGAAGRDSRASAVSKLIADGKLLPAQKSWAMKLSDKGFAGYVKGIGDAKVAPVGEKHKEPAAHAAGDPKAISADEARFGRLMGLKPEDIIAARNAKPKIGFIDFSKEN